MARGIRTQYLDYWLLRTQTRILPQGHSIPPCPVSGFGLGSQSHQVKIGTKAEFWLCGLPIQPLAWAGQVNQSINQSISCPGA